MHVATTGAVLRLNSAAVVPPCKYTFPATNRDEVLAVADLLTSTNFGSVIGLEQQLNGSAPALAPAITAILGVETRHDAFLRILHGVVPNPAPFSPTKSSIHLLCLWQIRSRVLNANWIWRWKNCVWDGKLIRYTNM